MGDGKLIFLTGGAGFIGSNVARSLTDEGRRVVISDRLGSDEKWQNLEGIAVDDVIHPDASVAWVSEHHRDLGAVIHMGAISATTERDVDSIIKNNIRLSIDLWSQSACNKIPFIYASSAATYGDGSFGFLDSERLHDLGKLRPLNAYGWSKWLIDRKFVSNVQQGLTHPPQWVGLRFFNVYGPYEDHKDEMRSVINKIYPLVRSGSPVSLFKSYNPNFGDGQQKRDFVYVDDCVSVIKWFLDNPAVSGIFNVGSGQARSFKDLAISVFSAASKKPEITYIEMPDPLKSKYQYFTQADISKLRKAGFDRPFTPLEQGVQKYVSTYLARRSEAPL